MPQPTDIEAVHLHQLTGAGDVEVALLLGLGELLRLGWRRGTGDEPETLGRGLEPVSLEHPVDPVGAELDCAPLLPSELGGDALGPLSGVSQRIGEDPLLDEHRGVVGHLRDAALARTQHLEPAAAHQLAPAVEGRRVDPQRPTGSPDASHLLGERKDSHAVAIQGIIRRQGGAPFCSTCRSNRRMRRLALLEWDFPRCRYDSGTEHVRTPPP